MESLTTEVSTSASERRSRPEDLAAEQSLKRAVRGLITRLAPMIARDRRRYARHSMPMLMELTPVATHTEEPVGSSMIVVGKSLSEHGLGFFHQHALPYRRAVIRIEDAPGNEDLVFLVDLAWCRYTRFGWYESGGRFLKLLESPFNLVYEEDAEQIA